MSGVYARSVYLCNYIYKPNLFLPLQCTGGIKANTSLRSTMHKLFLIPDLTSLFIVKDGTQQSFCGINPLDLNVTFICSAFHHLFTSQ